jgi:hypothetical protein
MQAYRLETTVTPNRTLELHSLPFQAGEVVEVIVLAKASGSTKHDLYPLRGKPVTYIEPTEPVAQANWGVLQ